MGFRLCLNTSTIKPRPMLEKVRLAAEAGFAGVELWINDVHEFVGRGGEVRDIERMLADHGLIVPCMIALRQWGEAVGVEYRLALEEARRRMELARRLGAPTIVATPPRQPCDLGQITERYANLLEIGREIGIRPLFEYISFFESVPSLSLAWKVVRDTSDPDAALVLDSFHTWNSGSSLEELEAIPAARIGHYHIDDADPGKPPRSQTDPDRVLPGDGPIDLAEEVRILRKIGYEGTVSLELFNEKLWRCDPAGVLKTGIERLRELFGPAPA